MHLSWQSLQISLRSFHTPHVAEQPNCLELMCMCWCVCVCVWLSCPCSAASVMHFALNVAGRTQRQQLTLVHLLGSRLLQHYTWVMLNSTGSKDKRGNHMLLPPAMSHFTFKHKFIQVHWIPAISFLNTKIKLVEADERSGGRQNNLESTSGNLEYSSQAIWQSSRLMCWLLTCCPASISRSIPTLHEKSCLGSFSRVGLKKFNFTDRH